MRLLTITVVILLCGFAVMRGHDVTGFAMAEASTHSPAPTPQALTRWRKTPGVMAAALGGSLMQSSSGITDADISRRTEDLTRLLAVKPLSPIDWLSLAGARVTTSAPDREIMAALTMSEITGPNEGAVMLQRGIFGLIEWGTLPTAMRAQTVRDLAGVIADISIPAQTADVIKAILAAKSLDTRARITAMFEAERVSEKQLVPLGL